MLGCFDAIPLLVSCLKEFRVSAIVLKFLRASQRSLVPSLIHKKPTKQLIHVRPTNQQEDV